MPPATDCFLTIEHKRLMVMYVGTHGGVVTRTIKDLLDFTTFCNSKADEAKMAVEDFLIYASPSLDSPEEYTDNSETIELARTLRCRSIPLGINPDTISVL